LVPPVGPLVPLVPFHALPLISRRGRAPATERVPQKGKRCGPTAPHTMAFGAYCCRTDLTADAAVPIGRQSAEAAAPCSGMRAMAQAREMARSCR
jgi:hypothetical protein